MKNKIQYEIERSSDGKEWICVPPNLFGSEEFLMGAITMACTYYTTPGIRWRIVEVGNRNNVLIEMVGRGLRSFD